MLGRLLITLDDARAELVSVNGFDSLQGPICACLTTHEVMSLAECGFDEECSTCGCPDNGVCPDKYKRMNGADPVAGQYTASALKLTSAATVMQLKLGCMIRQ